MKLGQVEASTHKMSYEFLVEVDSNIARNHFHSSQEVMITYTMQEIQLTKHSNTLNLPFKECFEMKMTIILLCSKCIYICL